MTNIWYLILSSDGLMYTNRLNKLTTERQAQTILTKLVRGHLIPAYSFEKITEAKRNRRLKDIEKMKQLETCYEVIEFHIDGYDLHKYGSHSASSFRNRRKSIPTQEKPLKETK